MDPIKRTAHDEASKRASRLTRCRVLSFNPNGDGGPVAFVVPYTKWDNWRREYDDLEAMLSEHGLNIIVRFPEGIKFYVDPDKYDVVLFQEPMFATEGFPKPRASVRAADARVARGWTEDDVNLMTPQLDAPDKHQVRWRAQAAVRGHRMFTQCEDTPQFTQPGDFWFGPLRISSDGARFEFWGQGHDQIMAMSRAAMNFTSEALRFPKTRGFNVSWRGRIENPMQDLTGSTAVTPYKRFIYTLFDPGIIVGAVQAIRTFFKELEGDSGFKFERIDRHEVVDYEVEVPIF